MSRPIRHVPPGGGLFFVTTRTIQGRFLLRPGSRLNRLILGVVGRAQRLYDVAIHAGIFLSGHYHLLIWVEDARQLASFMNHLNSNLAREAGRLHRWRERFWGRRYRPILVSDEPAAQIERLRYVLEQGCKEGLVASPNHWPGVTTVQALLSGASLEGVWVNRTKLYQASRRGEDVSSQDFEEREEVILSPLPCWSHLSPSGYQERVRELVEEIEQETAARHQRNGTQPLGKRAILKQHPHKRPAQSKRSAAPRFHCATRAMRKKLETAYFLFYLAYRDAADRLRRGDRFVTFPEGCFPPRLPFVQVRLAPD